MIISKNSNFWGLFAYYLITLAGEFENLKRSAEFALFFVFLSFDFEEPLLSLDLNYQR